MFAIKLSAKLVLIILILEIALGSFLRLYKLSSYPIQLNHDEITQLYDAISIAQTGKDIYGNYLPLIFESIGDYKPPFYTYMTVLFYLIFGNHEEIIRYTSVMFGILLITGVYLFSKLLFKNRTVALLSAFLTAIAPFEIFFSRKSFENGAGIFCMTMGFSALLYYSENKKKLYWLYIGMIILALGMYTYFSHAIIIPLLILCFGYIYWKSQILAEPKKYFVALILWLIAILPLLILIYTSSEARFRTQSVFITQDLNLEQNLNLIPQENLIITSILHLKTILDFSFNRYLDQFNLSYLFLNGLDLTNQGLLGAGPLFPFQLILIPLGVVFLIRQSNFLMQKKFIFAWILIGILPNGLTFEPHSPHRSVMVFTMLNIISALGAYYLVKLIINLRNMCTLKITFVLIMGLLVLFNFIYFWHIYLINYPFEKSQFLQYPFKQVAQFAWEKYPDYNQIIFDPTFGEHASMFGVGAYYYLGYYGNYPPATFQKTYQRKKDTDLTFDKFSIRMIDWSQDYSLKNTLLIASPWKILLDSISKDKIIKTFYFYDGKTAFYAISLK